MKRSAAFFTTCFLAAMSYGTGALAEGVCKQTNAHGVTSFVDCSTASEGAEPVAVEPINTVDMDEANSAMPPARPAPARPHPDAPAPNEQSDGDEYVDGYWIDGEWVEGAQEALRRDERRDNVREGAAIREHEGGAVEEHPHEVPHGGRIHRR